MSQVSEPTYRGRGRPPKVMRTADDIPPVASRETRERPVESAEPPRPPPEPQPVSEVPRGFYPMSEAPDDGKVVLLTDGKQVVPGYLKQTRYLDRKGFKWRHVGIWCRRKIDGGGPLGFVPIGFKAIPDNYGFEAPK